MTTTLPQPSKTVPAARSTEPMLDHERVLSGFHRDNLRRDNIDWVVAIFLAAMHVGCLAAPFFFSWSALGVCLFLHWLTCSIGVCLGYHRYLAHRSLKLAKPSEFFVLLCGSLSGEGSPLTWAATHRVHHQRSDMHGDPHSPNDGDWWSHILWVIPRRKTEHSQLLFRRYVPELQQRPMLQFFEKTYGWWLVVAGVCLLAIGAVLNGWTGALSMLLWGMCVRMTFAYHSTWLVNSATHMWGYRNYATRDRSRNLWWVALLAYGEGWHNNHHAHPTLAPAGHRWWEVDITWWSIKLLRFLGQASDVQDQVPQKGHREMAEGAMD